MSIKHAKTSAKSDGADTSLVRPSDWNAEHVLSSSAPTIFAVGTQASGTSDISPALPAGHTTNDILLLVVQTSQETVTVPSGYRRVGPQPGVGDSAAALSTRLSMFWKRDGGSESAPTVTDPGDHALAVIVGLRGCRTDLDPFLSAHADRVFPAGTSVSMGGWVTPMDNCLILNLVVHGLDTSSAVFSGWTNATLTSVTEQFNASVTDGNGGGIGIVSGLLASAGEFGPTTATQTSGLAASATLIVLPADGLPQGSMIDRQIFLNHVTSVAAGQEIWQKPTNAKRVRFRGIGGGASGSAGRNAATAAGGGGGGGGAYYELEYNADQIEDTISINAGRAGQATANTDGAAGNAGTAARATEVVSTKTVFFAAGGGNPGSSGSGSGGAGGAGGGRGTTLAASAESGSIAPPGGGTGGTTAGAGGPARWWSGGAGSGGGTSQGSTAAGLADRGGGGGGGGRASTTFGTGGGSVYGSMISGGATAGANGTDSPYPLNFGGSGAAGGTSTAGPGGHGGWPGGGGGGGGSQSGAQRGGAGGDGICVIESII